MIAAFKRWYHRGLLDEVMVVDSKEDQDVGKLTLENLKNSTYSLQHWFGLTPASGWSCLCMDLSLWWNLKVLRQLIFIICSGRGKFHHERHKETYLRLAGV